MIDLYIVGYPRSGNTWLGRLLADVLGCGYLYAPDGVPEFTGDKTDAPYQWHKSHSMDTLDHGRTVLIYRDPRDVACSVAHYSRKGNIAAAIESLTKPSDQFGTGAYLNMMGAWWYGEKAAAQVRYEDLHIAPHVALTRAIIAVTGITPTRQAIERAMRRQSFTAAQSKYNDKHHIWRGMVGGWQRDFDYGAAKLFEQHFGGLLIDQGYEPDGAWVETFAEKATA